MKKNILITIFLLFAPFFSAFSQKYIHQIRLKTSYQADSTHIN